MLSKRLQIIQRDIVSLYVNGKSVQWISSYCNVSPRSVYYILKSNRVKLRKRGPIKKVSNQNGNESSQRKQIDTPELENQLRFLRLYCELSIREMAWLLQVSTYKINKLLSKFGIRKHQD